MPAGEGGLETNSSWSMLKFWSFSFFVKYKKENRKVLNLLPKAIAIRHARYLLYVYDKSKYNN